MTQIDEVMTKDESLNCDQVRKVRLCVVAKGCLPHVVLSSFGECCALETLIERVVLSSDLETAECRAA